jgi:hypothetical protein
MIAEIHSAHFYVIQQDELQSWTILNVNENTGLLVFGALSYNPHPETGMLSVSEAYFLVRKWNVKECYLVHY